MPLRSEKLRMKTLVIDTITLLCKNGLANNDGYSIEGVIGVSSLRDEDDVFLIPINEIIKNTPEKHMSESESDSTDNSYSARSKRKRKHRASKNVESEKKRTHSQEDPFSNVPPQVKLENDADSDSGDLVMVKEEPSPARQRQLQATQLNASESAVINEAVNNSITSLTPIHSYQPVPPGWSPHQMHGLPHPLPSHQQQQHQQQQHHLQQHQQPEPKQSLPQIQGVGLQQLQTSDDFSRFTVDDMRSIAHRVVTTEGKFLTVRLMKRRVSRYPTAFIIKTMRDYMSRAVNDPLFLGCYKEPPRTKVFYKCPPEYIKDEALASVGCSRALYREMYNSVPKVQKWDKPEIQGRLLVSVVEASPFKEHYDQNVIAANTSLPRMKPPGAVPPNVVDGALDLSVDYHTQVDSPSVCAVRDENTLEEGELRRTPIIDNHATLAPLYAMANNLNCGNRHPEEKQQLSVSHIKEEQEEQGEKTAAGGGGVILSAQEYAEKAIMKTMYHDSSNNSHDANA